MARIIAEKRGAWRVACGATRQKMFCDFSGLQQQYDIKMEG